MMLPSIALTYFLEGNHERALKEAQKSLRHDPTDPASLAIMVAALSNRYCIHHIACVSVLTYDLFTREAALGSTNGPPHSVRLAQKALEIMTASAEKDLHQQALHEWLSAYVEQFV